MAFTDIEMAILSQLSYCGSKGAPSQPFEGQSLYDLLSKTEYRQYLEKSLGDNYKSAIDGLINKVKGQDYVIVKTADDKKGTGFAALAIKDPSNEVTVATRGTEGFDVFGSDDSRRDVESDLELAFAISTDQQREMEAFMRALEEDGYDGYYFTGHSLGGNLANYGAITFIPIDKVKGVVTFNAPGFNEAFLGKYSAEIIALYNRLKNYQNEYDYVSSIMTVPGQAIIIESVKDGGHLGFDDHMLDMLRIDGDEFGRREPQIKRIQTHILHGIVEMARSLTGMKQFTIILGVLEIGINLGRMAINALQGIAKWIADLFSGRNNYDYGSYIQLNTAKLRGYANRLCDVNRRIANLDSRMDGLYTRVGLLDLWNLLQADLLTGYSWKLTRCANYLYDTASDFENLETLLYRQIG